ncbi:serine hydrolase domain-containing protein [Macrococcus capreoli]
MMKLNKKFKIKKLIYVLLIFTVMLSGCAHINIRDMWFKDYKSARKQMESELPKNISERINRLIVDNQYSGSIYINYKGKEYKNAYGFQNIDGKIKNDNDTMYLVGSANKFITALMIKKLEKQHKISLNDLVVNYIPAFPNKQATVMDLLLHKSGLKPYEPAPTVNSLEQSITQINQVGLDASKIGIYKYNDANYITLAKILEVVTHVPYETNLEHMIVKPYHLEHTGTSKNTVLQSHFAEGMQFKNGKLNKVEATQPSAFYGAGDLYMSPSDYAKVVNAFKTYHVFDRATTLKMLNYSEIKQRYRYGMHVKRGYYRTRGYLYAQDLLCLFNKDYTIVVATNKVGVKGKLSNSQMMDRIRKNLLKSQIE